MRRGEGRKKARKASSFEELAELAAGGAGKEIDLLPGPEDTEPRPRAPAPVRFVPAASRGASAFWAKYEKALAAREAVEKARAERAEKARLELAETAKRLAAEAAERARRAAAARRIEAAAGFRAPPAPEPEGKARTASLMAAFDDFAAKEAEKAARAAKRREVYSNIPREFHVKPKYALGEFEGHSCSEADKVWHVTTRCSHCGREFEFDTRRMSLANVRAFCSKACQYDYCYRTKKGRNKVARVADASAPLSRPSRKAARPGKAAKAEGRVRRDVRRG